MASDPPQIRKLTIADLGAALRAGMSDFAAFPRYGLFFAGVHVLAGLVLV